MVPVHGALDAVDDCLTSVLAHTRPAIRLLVVDDASDPVVAAHLARRAEADPRVEVLTNEVNLGYLRSANRGLAATRAPYVCLLNSDTIVTPGWLEALIRCAESDARIAVVNPLSNQADNLSIPLAPGYDLPRMARRIGDRTPRYPDVVTAVGFCFFLPRATYARFGGFDEAYGRGYCEESDYCMRVTAAGLRVVVADDAYVFHRGGASFGAEREPAYRANRRLFDQRWGEAYARDLRRFQEADPLGPLRDELERDLRSGLAAPARALGPLQRLGLMTVDAWRRGGPRHLARKLRQAPARLRDAAGELRAGLPLARQDPLAPRVRYATRDYTWRLPRGTGLRIAILVYDLLDHSGGLLVIHELARGLILAGHSVTLVTIGAEPAPRDAQGLCGPLVFPNVEALAKGLPQLDLVLATFWPTAGDWLPRIKAHHPDLPSAYFLQDYEAWFYRRRRQALTRRRVLRSYGEADLRIVTSPWLRDRLAAHGHTSTVVPVGIDPRVFYPRPWLASEGPRRRVLVPARPHAPWRGFPEALETLRLLCAERAHVQAVLYGCDATQLRGYRLDVPHEHAGLIRDRQALAALVASVDVVYDPSRFQAFGLPGLEAMACGVPSVLPAKGGILQYARDAENCLLVPPGDPRAAADAIGRLLERKELRARVVRGGREAAEGYTLERMVAGHLALYEALVAGVSPA